MSSDLTVTRFAIRDKRNWTRADAVAEALRPREEEDSKSCWATTGDASNVSASIALLVLNDDIPPRIDMHAVALFIFSRSGPLRRTKVFLRAFSVGHVCHTLVVSTEASHPVRGMGQHHRELMLKNEVDRNTVAASIANGETESVRLTRVQLKPIYDKLRELGLVDPDYLATAESAFEDVV